MKASIFHFCDDIKDRIALIIALKVVHLKRKFGLEKKLKFVDEKAFSVINLRYV